MPVTLSGPELRRSIPQLERSLDRRYGQRRRSTRSGGRTLKGFDEPYYPYMVNRPNDRVLRAVHLSSELTTATELIALGLNQIANEKWVARQPGGAFNQLAQGVERVLKLSFGLNEQSQGRVVGAQFGSGGSGHGVITLHTRVMEILLAESSSAAPYVQGLLAETLADPYWADILTALDRWAATSGRYRDLDALRGRQVQGDPPWASWEEAEHRAVTELGGWGSLTDEVLARAREQMLLSIMRWWHTIYRSWQHGLLGAEGKVFASELSPQNRHLNPTIANLVNGT